MLLAAKSQPEAQGKKARFFHTLCTCGADALRLERFYPIGVRRPFSSEHRLQLRLRALTAGCAIDDNVNYAKALQALGAYTFERGSFPRRSDAKLSFCLPGRSRPTKSPG